MKKTMTLAEAKVYYDEERCFETETGFLVNDFGKYRPNITFIVPKTYDLDKNGKPINPLHYGRSRSDRQYEPRFRRFRVIYLWQFLA